MWTSPFSNTSLLKLPLCVTTLDAPMVHHSMCIQDCMYLLVTNILFALESWYLLSISGWHSQWQNWSHCFMCLFHIDLFLFEMDLNWSSKEYRIKCYNNIANILLICPHILDKNITTATSSVLRSLLHGEISTPWWGKYVGILLH